MKPIHPTPEPTGGSGSINRAGRTGKRLRRIERELSVTHSPRNSARVALCWGYNSHNRCRLTSDTCNRAHEKIKPKGLHRAVQSQLIRRAGLIGTKKIKPAEVDGFIQELRNADDGATSGKIEESRDHVTGGQEFESFSPEIDIPCLSGEEMDPFMSLADFPDHVCDSHSLYANEEIPTTIPTNADEGIIPSDILEVALTLMGDPHRMAVYATDQWLTPTIRLVMIQMFKKNLMNPTTSTFYLVRSLSLPHPNSRPSLNIK